jgi:hypothetical protein
MFMRNPLSNQENRVYKRDIKKGGRHIFLHITDVLAARPWSVFGRFPPVATGSFGSFFACCERQKPILGSL